MSRDNADVILAVGLAAVAIALVPARLDGTALATVVALPLVLLLPGLVLTAALLPRPGGAAGERLLLSLGLSLATAALGGLALNLTPWGLSPESWTLLLGGLTLLGGLVAAVRRWRSGQPASEPAGGTPPRDWLLAGLALLVVGGALALAIGGALRQPWPGFTQLWLRPEPTAVSTTLRLGVSNQERARADYLVRVVLADQPVFEAPIDLEPGARWETRLLLLDEWRAERSVEALLFRAADPATPYRRVTVWLTDAPGQAERQ